VKQDLKLGMDAGDRYRTVSEASILEMCHLAGWACESGEGSPTMLTPSAVAMTSLV
jgi:hypothetical protein